MNITVTHSGAKGTLCPTGKPTGLNGTAVSSSLLCLPVAFSSAIIWVCFRSLTSLSLPYEQSYQLLSIPGGFCAKDFMYGIKFPQHTVNKLPAERESRSRMGPNGQRTFRFPARSRPSRSLIWTTSHSPDHSFSSWVFSPMRSPSSCQPLPVISSWMSTDLLFH